MTPDAIYEARNRLLEQGKHPAMLLMTEQGNERLIQNLRQHNLTFGKIPMWMGLPRNEFIGIPIHIVEGMADDSFLLVDRETIRFWIYDLMGRP